MNPVNGINFNAHTQHLYPDGYNFSTSSQQYFQQQNDGTNSFNRNWQALSDSSQYFGYNFNYSSDISPTPPPPPDGSLPPPPPPPLISPSPESTLVYNVYSPSRANSDDEEMEGADDPGELEIKQRAIDLAEKLKWEESERLREEKEREEHDRRVEAENKKKRKLSSRSGAVVLSKLKRVELKAFGDDNENDIGGSKPNLESLSADYPADPSKVSEDVLQAIMKTVTWVAANEDKVAVLLENSKSNPKLRFLFEKESSAGLRYLQELQRVRSQRRVQDVISGIDESPPSVFPPHVQQTHCSILSSHTPPALQSTYSEPPPPPPPPPPLVPTHSMWSLDQRNSIQQEAQRAVRDMQLLGALGPLRSVQHVDDTPAAKSTGAPSVQPIDTNDASSSSTGGRRERRNRWGPPIPGAPIPTTVVVPVAVAPAEPTDARWSAQLREQKELQLLESRIREAAAQSLRTGQDAVVREQELYQERLRQYELLAKLESDERDTVEDAEDNGGVIEGGTWEHRKRAKEMLVTAQKNLELTMLASGKHHLADFLPKDELDKFLKKADAVTSGIALPVESDFTENAITEDNVGFQLLKKAGWSAGEGLGSDGSGAMEPVNMQGMVEGTGIGVQSTHEVDRDDTAFEQYRKRMMLAYRFRPNPLNNPRRDYY